MHGKHLFEYAVIRVVPHVEREEFLNVGVILYCKKLNFLEAKCGFKEDRLLGFSPDSDVLEIRKHLKAFGDISRGSKEGGPIAKLDMPSRFRWLTATRSTVIQTSKVHPGFCEDADFTLKKLFAELVEVTEAPLSAPLF